MVNSSSDRPTSLNSALGSSTPISFLALHYGLPVWGTTVISFWVVRPPCVVTTAIPDMQSTSTRNSRLMAVSLASSLEMLLAGCFELWSVQDNLSKNGLGDNF